MLAHANYLYRIPLPERFVKCWPQKNPQQNSNHPETHRFSLPKRKEKQEIHRICPQGESPGQQACDGVRVLRLRRIWLRQCSSTTRQPTNISANKEAETWKIKKKNGASPNFGSCFPTTTTGSWPSPITGKPANTDLPSPKSNRPPANQAGGHK